MKSSNDNLPLDSGGGSPRGFQSGLLSPLCMSSVPPRNFSLFVFHKNIMLVAAQFGFAFSPHPLPARRSVKVKNWLERPNLLQGFTMNIPTKVALETLNKFKHQSHSLLGVPGKIVLRTFWSNVSSTPSSSRETQRIGAESVSDVTFSSQTPGSHRQFRHCTAKGGSAFLRIARIAN